MENNIKEETFVTLQDTHEYKEAQAALIGGMILCGIGVFIAFESITKISNPSEIDFQAIAMVTILINITLNGFFSYYKFYIGGQTRSISLIADAYHTKTDIWSSVAVLIGLLGAAIGFPVLIGLLGAAIGFPVLDAVAGAVVSLFIMLGGVLNKHLITYIITIHFFISKTCKPYYLQFELTPKVISFMRF